MSAARQTRVLTWNRVEAEHRREWRSACGRYVIWVQERGPRGDSGPGYAASRTETAYAKDGRPAKWIVNSAPMKEAKEACEKDALDRAGVKS